MEEGGAKDKFVEILKGCARFCGVKVNTKSAMGNHFHIVVKVPRRPDVLPTDEELIARVEAFSGHAKAADLRQRLEHLCAQGAQEEAQAERERYFKRMWDLSAFMKEVNQRFTEWYNHTFGRKGTLWEGRFHSVLLERGTALLNECVYIELNSFRAKIADDPREYKWCGYAEALSGDEEAYEGIKDAVEAVGLVRGEQLQDRQAVLDAYERYMVQHATKELGVDQDGNPFRRVMDRKEIVADLEAGKKVSRGDYLRVRVRYFTAAWAIGSREFVEAIFQANKSRFGPKRKTGARLMKGLADEKLYSLRDLRLKVFG